MGETARIPSLLKSLISFSVLWSSDLCSLWENPYQTPFTILLKDFGLVAETSRKKTRKSQGEGY